MREGKTPLDRGRSYDDGRRAEAYAAIARRQGETAGAKEMAMTRRPRGEAPASRAGRFMAMARTGDER